MQAPSATFVEALSAEEVCPLCLDRYTAADECACVQCGAPSCPGCAETIDADGATRCFACRPALAPQRRLSQVPVALPRPIQFPVAARAAQPRGLSSQLSGQLLVTLRAHGAALSSALKLRATALFAAAFVLSQRVPPLARAAWARLPAARQLQQGMQQLERGIELLVPRLRQLSLARVPRVHLSRRQLVRYGRYRRSVRSLYSSGLRSRKKPMEALSSRILARSKSARITPSSERPSSVNL